MTEASKREEVIDWYNQGGHKNPWLSDKMTLNLTDQEKVDLLGFLVEGLTGEFPT